MLLYPWQIFRHPVSKLDTIDNTTEDFEGAKRTYKARNVELQIDAVQDLWSLNKENIRNSTLMET